MFSNGRPCQQGTILWLQYTDAIKMTQTVHRPRGAKWKQREDTEPASSDDHNVSRETLPEYQQSTFNQYKTRQELPSVLFNGTAIYSHQLNEKQTKNMNSLSGQEGVYLAWFKRNRECVVVTMGAAGNRRALIYVTGSDMERNRAQIWNENTTRTILSGMMSMFRWNMGRYEGSTFMDI